MGALVLVVVLAILGAVLFVVAAVGVGVYQAVTDDGQDVPYYSPRSSSNTASDGEEYYPDPRDEFVDTGCAGDCNDMDNDGRTYDDVDADHDGRYETP